jgi:phosphate starvation-inducible PhoH-like protein
MNQEKEMALTANHRRYQQLLHDRESPPIFAIGRAGTGKTFGAVKAALDAYKKHKTGIVVIRPNVSYAGTLGFTKGDINEKLQPWTAPIRQCLLELDVGPMEQEKMERSGKLEFIALEHIQGQQFDDCVVIFDEVQNTEFNGILMACQRIGRNCRMVLCGDVRQVAIGFKDSGLAKFLDMNERQGLEMPVVEFKDEADVLRSGWCRKITLAAEDYIDRFGI